MIKKITKLIDTQTEAAAEARDYLRLGRHIAAFSILIGGAIVIYNVIRDRQKKDQEPAQNNPPGDE